MAKSDKPNILVIWGDDIGISNLSCYSHGLMGYQTPNIDRLAREGMMFTDSYGEQSCTAGRSSFITGQSVYRTGLSKVGIPGAPVGMSDKIITIAAALKNQGYSTGRRPERSRIGFRRMPAEVLALGSRRQSGSDLDLGSERPMDRAAIGDGQEPRTLLLVQPAVELDVPFDERQLGFMRFASDTVLGVDP